MCYPKPGPRCSAHAAEVLFKAKIAKASASEAEFASAQKKLDEAQLEYDATPAGIKDLERRLEKFQSKNKPDIAGYGIRITLAKATRAAKLAAIKAKDTGDKTHTYEDAIEASYPTHMKSFARSENDYPSKKMALNSPEVQTMIANSSRWLSKLSTEELAVTSWYTSDGSEEVNSHLYGEDYTYNGKIDTEKALKAVKYLDSAIAKSELKEPIKVYRGIDADILEYEEYNPTNPREYIADKFKVGQTIKSQAFESSSIDFHAAKSFATSGVLLEIVAKKAAPVSNISAFGMTEFEYVLPREQGYRVVSVKPSPLGKNLHIIQLEQL